MHDQVTAIKEYYINLDYIQNKTDAEEKLSILTEQIKQEYYDTLSERLFKTACIIKNNWFLFASLCKHVDTVNTIIQYLTDIGIKMKFIDDECFDEEDVNNFDVDNFEELKQLMLLTLCSVCPEFAVQSFLRVALASYKADLVIFKFIKGTQINEMILLEDSDLDAVISCLRIIENCELTKIWVHKQIKEKFLWFKMKYFRDSDFPIHTFRSKQELFTSHIYYRGLNIVSIWSEDIVAAKNLAKSLNKTILFINTHMDFYGDVVLIPYTKLMYSLTHAADEFDCPDDFVPDLNENEIDATCASKMISFPVYNLFYDGKWQKSTKTTYYKRCYGLWANATIDDIQECLNSADKGFKIWSAQSFQYRIEILRDLIKTVFCNGFVELKNGLINDIVLNLNHFYNQFRTRYFKRKRLEITEQPVPLGIVVLKETNENIFFDRLFKLLITGNSVIIIHNAILYNFTQYCDMFTTYGIPPGVINMLSNEDIIYLELLLCKTDYTSYVESVYSDNFSGFPVQSKQIILPLK